MKTVTITFNRKGGATVATSGFAGAECQRATAEFEETLFGRKVSDTPTPEAKLAPSTLRGVPLGGGR